MVTEFGAEANRDGPVEEKGTWAFQQDWINYQLGVFATEAVAQRRHVLGAERVLGPAGLGGRESPPAAPVHQKGLVTYDGVRKPAFSDVQRSYTTTPQLIPTGR